MDLDDHFVLHSFKDLFWDEFIKLISREEEKEKYMVFPKMSVYYSGCFVCLPRQELLYNFTRSKACTRKCEYIMFSSFTKEMTFHFWHTYSGGQGSALQALWFSGGLLSGSQKLFWTMELSSNLLQTTSCLWRPLKKGMASLIGE